MVIDHLTAEDVQVMVNAAKLAHEEATSFDHYTPDWGYVEAGLRAGFEEDLMLGFRAYGGAGTRGLIFGCLFQNWFSPDLCGAELLTYVAPEFRGTSTAYRLYAAFEEECEARGCVEVHAGASLDINRPAVGRLLTKLGFEEGPPGFTKKF